MMKNDSINNPYLQLTDLVDFDKSIVKQKAFELTDGINIEHEKVKRIYHFVRDEIPYTFTHNLQKASDVLREQVGQCNTKTTLTIALLRAINIPARYHCGSISKSLFKNIIPAWAYLFTPKIIPGHCWPEVFINNKWTAIENVMDLNLYEGIEDLMLQENQAKIIGCGLSNDTFQKTWDGNTDVLMQDGALVENIGIMSNADVYLAKSERFLNPIKYWLKNMIVKKSMNKVFNDLRIRKLKNKQIDT